MTKEERVRAGEGAAAVDEVLLDPEARPALPAEDAGLVDTARHLAQLPALLGPVDPAFEQQIMRRVRLGPVETRRRPRLRLAWAVAGVAALLVLAMLVTPLGQTAVASFLAVFHLGRTQVSITPVDVASVPSATAAAGSAVVERLTLDEARDQVSFAIPQPAYLPAGYRLQGVNSYSYPYLPAWVPQPFFVELVYADGAGQICTLRLYPIMLGQEASISRLNLEAAPIHDVQDVDVGGQPGVLLQLGAGSGWQEVVWEQGDLVLALSAADLSEADLLRVARSVR